MRKLYTIAIAMGVMLTFNSCSRFEDPIFDQSSAQRMNEAFAKYDEILQQAPYGWSLNYYYGDYQNPDGGYKMLIKFKDGMVDLASELTANKVEAGTVVKSSYSFASDNGPILSFDSYNPVLHFYSEATSSNPQGLGGDFEFILESVTPEKIVMRGKKFANQLVMRPLKEEKDFKAYVDEVKALKALMSKLMRFELQNNGAASQTAINLDQSKWYDTEYPEDITRYAVSDEGIDLQKPVQIDGKAYEEFIFDEASLTFHAKENKAITLKSVKLDYTDIPGNYVLSYISNVGSKNEVVQVTENVAGKSYTLTSKTFIRPIQLDYVNGNLVFKPQNLGKAPAGASGNLWMTVGYETNLLGYIINTFETNATHIMAGLWMRGTREKPQFTVMSQYNRPGLFGSSPMKYLGLHTVVGSSKEFYSNEEGVRFMFNIKLAKQ